MHPQVHFLVQSEYREWERQFNKRAQRGDFVREDLEAGALHHAPRAAHPRAFLHGFGTLVSMLRVRPQVASGD
jgi:hypothetical protein